MAAATAGALGSSSSATTAPLAWHDFLERMSHPSASDFVKSIKSFIISFSNSVPDPEKDSAAVQEFLAKMEGSFRSHNLWAGSSEEELQSAGEGLEKYVMTKLFNRAFASLPEEVHSDEELFEKIALLQQLIQPENLDIKPVFQNETSWLLAQKELQKINMYKAPRDKLVCILNCCKVINNLLRNVSMASKDNPPGADDFLPVLIYVTIKARSILHSCIQICYTYNGTGVSQDWFQKQHISSQIFSQQCLSSGTLMHNLFQWMKRNSRRKWNLLKQIFWDYQLIRKVKEMKPIKNSWLKKKKRQQGTEKKTRL
ncbi:vacuolar protein sorting-associated protein 9A-like [Iris pallida]|uniref:Vacuolar protein sorting-associated protein 9A-like n=1 Tax=Iris pallida TaxID=29817 RepID=A0AAX6EYR1_IRIPA|nr:vacuolar protein sorting-associated protein 9A-like [Iris pallida]